MGDNHIGNTNNSEFDGLVWILNGRVYVKDEAKYGIPPLINPCEGVKLLINGIEVNHLTTVSEKDEIKLIPLETEKEFEIDIELSEDKLTAYGYFTPSKIVKNIIVDTYPLNKLDIELRQVELETKKVTKDKLLEYLNEHNIVYGINEDAIEEICKKNSPGRYLIAEGKPAVSGTDDWVEYFFSETPSIEIKENKQGTVDYRNIIDYDSVNPGQTIAQLHKGDPGIDGMNVYGEVIKATQPVKLVIAPTFSISYDEKTGLIKALKHGRPSKMIKGGSIAFHVYDTLSLDEVSIKTGNVKYKGDIEIQGNIFESMEVIAKQSVLVKGSVNFASVYAGNCITVKGMVVSSTINAAINDTIAKDPSPLLEKLIEGINRLIDNVNTFPINEKEKQNLKDNSSVIRHLINNQNKDLPSTVYEVLNSLRKGNFDVEEDFIIQFLNRTRPLMGNFSEITSVEYLNNVVESLKSLFRVKDVTKIKGNINLSSVLNSDVTALGDITVSGKGCFNSKLYSNGKIIVNSNVRGGQLRAEKGIDVFTAGTDMGVKTLFVVPEDGYINIKTAYPDVTIKIGGASHTFLAEKRMVWARLASGKIVF